MSFINKKNDEPNSEGDVAAVKTLVDDFFTGLELKDSVKLKSILSMNGHFYATIKDKDAIKFSHRKWLDQITSDTSSLKERYWHTEIKVNKTIATVWTDYDFYRNGKFSHCGTNLMNLVKQKNGWQVADAYFTVEKDCAESPLGPYFEE